MIILFSGCDKVKGFNSRIKEIINKELDRYNSMAIICAKDDYSKNDTLIDGTSDKIGIRSMFNSIKNFYLIDRRTSINDMTNIIKKVDIIYLFGGNPLIQLDIRIDYKELFKDKVLLGFSAGSMNLGKIGYYSKDDDYDKTFFYEGLGFTDITIDPHFDINNRKQVNEMVNSSYKHRIIGLPNDSCIVIKDNEIYYINNYFVVEDGKIEERKGDDLYEEHRNNRIRNK